MVINCFSPPARWWRCIYLKVLSLSLFLSSLLVAVRKLKKDYLRIENASIF